MRGRGRRQQRLAHVNVQAQNYQSISLDIRGPPGLVPSGTHNRPTDDDEHIDKFDDLFADFPEDFLDVAGVETANQSVGSAQSAAAAGSTEHGRVTEGVTHTETSKEYWRISFAPQEVEAVEGSGEDAPFISRKHSMPLVQPQFEVPLGFPLRENVTDETRGLPDMPPSPFTGSDNNDSTSGGASSEGSDVSSPASETATGTSRVSFQHYARPTIFVDTEECLKICTGHWEKRKILGVDVKAWQDRVCLLQLSDEFHDFIIDAVKLRTVIPIILIGLFRNPDITKIVHDANHDIKWLKRDFGIEFGGMFDTYIASGVMLKGRGQSLPALVEKLSGVSMPPMKKKVNWSTRPLPPEMIDYARADTCYLFDIYVDFVYQLMSAGEFDNVLQKSSQVCLRAKKFERMEPVALCA